MNNIKIEHSDDEESFSIYVNGEEIASFNYDEHGSTTMDAVNQLVKRISEKTGIDLQEEYLTGD